MSAISKNLKLIGTSTPFLLSGLALALLVFLDFPMYVFLSLQLITFCILFYISHKRKAHTSSGSFGMLVRSGFYAGLIATATYDVVRLLIVALFHFKIRPFDTFRFFGQIILGHPTSDSEAYTIGFLYHLLNGVTFAIAFFLVLRGRHWAYGIIWAFVLEILMLLIYPRLLNLRSFMEEFTIVSCSGHTAYGLILGLFNYYKFGNVKSATYANS